MKKLFTLLTLLVAIVTGAKAQTDFVLYTSASAGPTLPMTNDGITVSASETQLKNGSSQVADVATAAGIPSTKIYVISLKGGGMIDIDAGEGNTITSISMIVGRNSSGSSVNQFGHGGFSNDQTEWSEITALSAAGYDKGTKIDVTPTGKYRYYSFGRGQLGSTKPAANTETRVYKITVTVAASGPEITTQPQSASYMTGQTIAALTVAATPATATFQWYSCDDAAGTNPVELTGETSASYTPTAAGFYFVAVTDGGVTVNSDVAEITVSAAEAPNISVSGAPAEAVKVGAEVILTAEATGTPTPTITWYDGNNASVGTGDTYTVPTDAAGTYTFYAVASNGVGTDATSATQTIVVKEQVATPTITPNGAYFEDEQEVTLACTTDGATIQYSTDNGATWTNYTAALTFTATTTLQAKATKTGCIDSETASANFTLFEKAELASVSAETTWDFTGWNQELQLSDTTTPTSTDEYTYSDIALINGSITLPSGFNGEAMMFKGQYPVRSKKAQAGTWTIKTTKPGTLAVTFSDTGSKGDNPPKRYLNINGTNTEYYTQRTGSSSDQKTVTVDISAGENVITGMGEDGTTWQAICLYKIVYTPIDVDIVLDESGNNATTIAANDGQTNQKVFVNRKLSTSYYNTLFLPFAMTAEQMTAAFGEGAQVATFVKMNSATEFGFGNVTAMEANVPYLVKPAQEVNGFTVEGVTISNTAAAGVVDGGYSMVGTYDTFTNGSSTSGGISIGGGSSITPDEIYYFATTGKIKKLTSTGSIKGLRAFMVKLPAGKTSVETIVSNAGLQFGGGGDGTGGSTPRARQDFVLYLDDDNTTTGIEAIENGQLTIDNDAPAYNLAGQKVGKGYKGIVIINGKKVVK